MRRDRDVATDQAGEPVPRALDRGTAQNPHAPRIPLIRLEAVDRYVVGVAEAVEAVLPDFRQRELLVALLAEQEPAVIRPPAEMIGSAHDRPPSSSAPRSRPRCRCSPTTSEPTASAAAGTWAPASPPSAARPGFP